MSIADAVSEAQLAVVKAEAAAALDIGSGEASAELGTVQASVAYQLVIQILQDKVVELAPALIAVEVAAINEGIAAYLAEQELSIAIEKDIQAKTEFAFDQVQASFETDRQDVSLEFLADSIHERLLKRAALVPGQNVADALQEVFNEVDTAVTSAIEIATAGAN